MCGRYGLIKSPKDEDFSEYFGVEGADIDEFTASYNIAPGTLEPVITANSPKHIQKMKWGLVPFWAREFKPSFSTINARSESVAVSPAYREPFKKHRCLIPASFFYEWSRSGNKEEIKWPYYFGLKGKGLFAFAGLYDIWKDAVGKEFHTYTILTTGANDVVSRVHDRMPVILHRKDFDTWTENNQFKIETLHKLLVPYPDSEMESFRVSKLVNNPQADDPSLIKPEE